MFDEMEYVSGGVQMKEKTWLFALQNKELAVSQRQKAVSPPEELHLSSVVVRNGLVLADLSLWPRDIQTGIVNPEEKPGCVTGHIKPASTHLSVRFSWPTICWEEHKVWFFFNSRCWGGRWVLGALCVTFCIKSHTNTVWLIDSYVLLSSTVVQYGMQPQKCHIKSNGDNH